MDQIVRKAYDKIYKGNLQNLGEATKTYMSEYVEHIFEGPEANITPMSGKHLRQMAETAKESAGGMDQWTPGDFRLLSDLAYEHLAHMLNGIEETGTWPKDLLHAGAAFLAKEDEEALDPLGFRCLLMLPAIYRL